MIIVALGFMGTGCQDITVGYLLTEDASYEIDSLVIKSVLDTRPRLKFLTRNFKDTWIMVGMPNRLLVFWVSSRRSKKGGS